MKIFHWLPLLLALLLLPTGCATGDKSVDLSPGTIHTTFDNVQVSIAHGLLHVTVTDLGQDLKDLQVESASASTWTNEKPLTLQQANYSPTNPHQMELIFAPAPTPPFSINLTTQLKGNTLYLRADYYGPKGITF